MRTFCLSELGIRIGGGRAGADRCLLLTITVSSDFWGCEALPTSLRLIFCNRLGGVLGPSVPNAGEDSLGVGKVSGSSIAWLPPAKLYACSTLC